jgi:hypothetical protein
MTEPLPNPLPNRPTEVELVGSNTFDAIRAGQYRAWRSLVWRVQRRIAMFDDDLEHERGRLSMISGIADETVIGDISIGYDGQLGDDITVTQIGPTLGLGQSQREARRGCCHSDTIIFDPLVINEPILRSGIGISVCDRDGINGLTGRHDKCDLNWITYLSSVRQKTHASSGRGMNDATNLDFRCNVG